MLNSVQMEHTAIKACDEPPEDGLQGGAENPTEELRVGSPPFGSVAC